MQQHKVRARIDPRRMKHLRPRRVRIIAEARLAHMDDVVRDNLRAQRSRPQ